MRWEKLFDCFTHILYYSLKYMLYMLYSNLFLHLVEALRPYGLEALTRPIINEYSVKLNKPKPSTLMAF